MNKKPTALKVLQGTARNHRLNMAEPKPAKLDRPAAPRDLAPAQREAWKFIVEHLAHLHVLTVADLPALRLLAGEQAELWAMERGVEPSTPGQRSAVRKQLMNALGRFGLTPVDRQRVAAKAPDASSALDEFA